MHQKVVLLWQLGSGHLSMTTEATIVMWVGYLSERRKLVSICYRYWSCNVWCCSLLEMVGTTDHWNSWLLY